MKIARPEFSACADLVEERLTQYDVANAACMDCRVVTRP
jgi:hypothetical protein